MVDSVDDEVLALIFRAVPAPDRLRCEEVCVRWRRGMCARACASVSVFAFVSVSALVSVSAPTLVSEFVLLSAPAPASLWVCRCACLALYR